MTSISHIEFFQVQDLQIITKVSTNTFSFTSTRHWFNKKLKTKLTPKTISYFFSRGQLLSI